MDNNRKEKLQKIIDGILDAVQANIDNWSSPDQISTTVHILMGVVDICALMDK